VYYKLLQPNQIINAERYRHQLLNLNRALKKMQYAKRYDKIRGNAKSHVAEPIKEILEALKWNVLPHPSYSPMLQIIICFGRCSTGLSEQHFSYFEDIKK